MPRKKPDRRRVLAKVVDDDRNDAGSRAGRPVLYGFGYRYLQRIGRIQRRSTLAETVKGGVPLNEPVLAVAWGLARRGKRDLAVAVLKEFGLATKYKVSHRTIKLIVAPVQQPGTKKDQ